jgi:prefoldin subunit 5
VHRHRRQKQEVHVTSDVTDLQVDISFLQRRVDDLSDALIDKERRLSKAEARVDALERALRVLAQRGTGENPSAFPEEDPVPKSG